MYFINFPKKFSFSFLTFIVALFSIASITFGTINSSAHSNDSQQKTENSSLSDLQTKPFDFPVAIPNKDDVRQSGFSPESGQSEEIADSPVFAEFDAWVKKRVNGNFSSKSEYDELGERLAVERRQALKKLIQSNPKAAFEKTISSESHKNLPSFITRYLEKRVSAYGDFLVYIVDEIDHTSGEMSGSHMKREIVFDDSRYKAFVYGRRETMTTKYDIPLQGFVIDDLMLVDESPARKLESKEGKTRAANLSKFNKFSIAAELGGKTIHFSNQTELDDFVDEQVEWEAKIGPVRPKQNSAQNNLAPEQATSAWTEGIKTVLVIRVEFPDRLGDPVDSDGQPLTAARAQNLFTNEINPFYVSNSYNKTSLQATITPLVRLPQTQTYYAQGSNKTQLQADARLAARQAGFETNNFNLDIVAFSFSGGFDFTAESAIGGKGNLLNGNFSLNVVAHELGHNYGLLHANLWRTSDGNPIGKGSNVEYGDCFDMMADCFNLNSSSHFNTRYKRLLNWLTDANVQPVTSSDNYRIYAQDVASPGGIRTLKIKKDDTKNYWVEFRKGMNGALLRWDYDSKNFDETQLLDMTPATPDTSDALLLIGQPPFIDSESGIKITVEDKTSTTPESLLVKVEFIQPVCNYLLSSSSQYISYFGDDTKSTNVATSAACAWTATSSDESWLIVTDGSMGTGDGIVRFKAGYNSGAERSGTITIAGQPFTVTQGSQTPSCTFSLSSPSANFGPTSESGSVNINSGTGCSWTVVSNVSWITINGGANRSGSGSVSFSIASNKGLARSGTVTAGGQTFTINQSKSRNRARVTTF